MPTQTLEQQVGAAAPEFSVTTAHGNEPALLAAIAEAEGAPDSS